MVVNEEQAAIVRQIFDWFAYGEGEEGPLSTQKIAERLTALNIATPQDTHEKHTHVKQRAYGHWSRVGIYAILRQNAYNGVFNHKIGGKVIGIPVPRIVDEETFTIVQKKLNEGRLLSHRGVQYEYLVGRRIKCECGYSMYSSVGGKGYTTADGQERRYQYYHYRCAGRGKNTEMVRQCDMPVLQVGDVDAKVWQWVKEEIANPDVLERKLREVQDNQREENSGKQRSLELLEQHKAEIEAELERLAKLYDKGMPARIADKLIAEEAHKLELVEAEITNRTRQIGTPLTDATIYGLIEFSRQFAEHLDAVEKTFEGRRTVVNGLNVRVVALRKDGEIKLKMTSILNPEGVMRTLSDDS